MSYLLRGELTDPDVQAICATVRRLKIRDFQLLQRVVGTVVGRTPAPIPASAVVELLRQLVSVSASLEDQDRETLYASICDQEWRSEELYGGLRVPRAYAQKFAIPGLAAWVDGFVRGNVSLAQEFSVAQEGQLVSVRHECARLGADVLGAVAVLVLVLANNGGRAGRAEGENGADSRNSASL